MSVFLFCPWILIYLHIHKHLKYINISEWKKNFPPHDLYKEVGLWCPITSVIFSFKNILGLLSRRRKVIGTHSSTLAWTIPWTEEPGRLQSMGSLRVGHDWATSLSLFTFMRWRRKWQPTPVFLPGESQGRRSLVGCRLWGRRVGHDWSDLAAAWVAVQEVSPVCTPLKPGISRFLQNNALARMLLGGMVVCPASRLCY